MQNDSSWYKQRQEFNDLVDLWDKAQADGIFTSEKKNTEVKSDFFGQSYFADDPDLQEDETSYWSDVVSRSGEMFPDESMFLMEAAKKKATAKKEKNTKDVPLGDMGTKPFKRVETSVEKDGLPPLKK